MTQPHEARPPETRPHDTELRLPTGRAPHRRRVSRGYRAADGVLQGHAAHVDFLCQPLARIARFNPASWRTPRPGASTVPFAEAVMFLVLSFSNTTTAFLAHSVCAVCAAQSARRARTRPVSADRAALVLARLFDPRRWRHRRRRRRRSRSCSFGVWKVRSSRSPSLLVQAGVPHRPTDIAVDLALPGLLVGEREPVPKPRQHSVCTSPRTSTHRSQALRHRGGDGSPRL